MKRWISLMLISALLLAFAGMPALASGYVKFTGSCHVYKDAGTYYGYLGIIKKGSTLPYLGYSKYSGGVKWYNVEFNGKDGWVSSDYGYLTSSSGTAKYAEGGSGGSYDGYVSGSFAYGSNVYIRGNCNIRSGPSLDHSRLGVAYSGDVLYGAGTISTDSRGVDWYSVKYHGKTAWVSSVYASLKKKSSGGSSGDPRVVGVDGDSHVRKGPGLYYESVGVLHVGESAPYRGKKSKDDRGVYWYKITWKGSSAWVSSKYTELK